RAHHRRRRHGRRPRAGRGREGRRPGLARDRHRVPAGGRRAPHPERARGGLLQPRAHRHPARDRRDRHGRGAAPGGQAARRLAGGGRARRRQALPPPAGRPARGAGERLPAPARARRPGPAGAPPRRGRHGAVRGGGAGALRAHGERLRAPRLQGREPRDRPPQHEHGERGDEGRRGAGRSAPPPAPAPGGQLRRQRRGQRPGAWARRRDRVRGPARQRRLEAHRGRLRGALRRHRPGRRTAGGVAARPPPPLARQRARAGAHRLHAVRRLADPGLRARLHQVPRALGRARRRERGQGGGQGGARPRAARDRRRAGGGAMRIRRARPGAAPPAAGAPLLCRWDLDKTYLRSEFDSLRSLLRTAFERAEDKVEVPGVAELIRALKAAAERHGRKALVYFVSASPPQIGAAVRKKLALDGVPYDGIVFKDQLAHLRRGKLRNLREHVGFKLGELLRGRLAAPPGAAELLFGDDWELDSLIYSLYADVLAARLPPAHLEPLLRRIRVDPGLADEILALAGRAAGGERVARIFINLERRSPPATFRLFGPGLVPTFNYFQTAAVLGAEGYLGAEDVARVGRVLLEGAGYTARGLENSLGDLVRRGFLEPAAAGALGTRLRAAGVLPPADGPRARWRRVLGALGRLRRRRRMRAGRA